jgi:hypothetical protein
MTGEEWAAAIGGTVAAVAGSVAVVVRAMRPAPKLKQAPGVTPADLDAIRHEMRDLVRVAVKAVEEACEQQSETLRSRLDEQGRAWMERAHAHELKLERIATAMEEREPRRSRRGGE